MLVGRIGKSKPPEVSGSSAAPVCCGDLVQHDPQGKPSNKRPRRDLEETAAEPSNAVAVAPRVGRKAAISRRTA